MILVAGLGNIGLKYSLTRHNFGFMILDEIANKNGLKWIESKKFKSYYTKLNDNNIDILMIKPTTYMNLSGESVALWKNFYKLHNNDIYVVYDDIDMEFGKIRKKIDGGSGGHNGIKSINSCIGTDYTRIKCGVGRDQRIDPADFVLSKFKAEEIIEIQKEICDRIYENIITNT